LKAFILAAGRGERMRPLTDRLPKPLLAVGGKSLIVRHLEALARAGYREVVVNRAHLGALLVERLGDGHAFGLHIEWSPEGEGPIGTAAGLRRARPLLGEAPFLLVNGDVYTDYDFSRCRLPTDDLARLVLVDSPREHPGGDFLLSGQRVVEPSDPGPSRLTYAGIACLAPAILDLAGEAELGVLLRAAAAAGRVGAEHHRGDWVDVGTPERLLELDERLGGRLHGLSCGQSVARGSS
jgi:N-acetyl-alpha-D-muramate 1-phosphate uridylyltransferase